MWYWCLLPSLSIDSSMYLKWKELIFLLIHVSFNHDANRSLTHLLQTSFLTHLLGAEVGVAAGSVPVAWNRLGVKRGHNAKVFTNPVQEEAGNPQMVSHFNPLTRANLEFPLKNKTTSWPHYILLYHAHIYSIHTHMRRQKTTTLDYRWFWWYLLTNSIVFIWLKK